MLTWKCADCLLFWHGFACEQVEIRSGLAMPEFMTPYADICARSVIVSPRQSFEGCWGSESLFASEQV